MLISWAESDIGLLTCLETTEQKLQPYVASNCGGKIGISLVVRNLFRSDPYDLSLMQWKSLGAEH